MQDMEKHLSKSYEDQLSDLYEKFAQMGSRVERMLTLGEQALVERDVSHLDELERLDSEVDDLEIIVDEESFHILASRQPVAGDLRFIIALIKAVVDIERIGDQAANIYHLAKKLSREPEYSVPTDVPATFDLVRKMVMETLDALISRDAAKAHEILEKDDAVDRAYKSHRKSLAGWMKQSGENVDRGIKLFFIAKYLERIADHSTNIAEQTIFLVEGEDVRHREGEELGF